MNTARDLIDSVVSPISEAADKSLNQLASQLKNDNKQIVFTNGEFFGRKLILKNGVRPEYLSYWVEGLKKAVKDLG